MSWIRTDFRYRLAPTIRRGIIDCTRIDFLPGRVACEDARHRISFRSGAGRILYSNSPGGAAGGQAEAS